MKGRVYSCADCGEQVRGSEIANLTAAERRTLQDGSYLCSACREERQVADI